MKFYAAFLLVAATASCASVGASYSIEVVKQAGQQWRFERLTAYEIDDGTHIRGRLTATQRFGLPTGHVDIAAYSPDGELIEETTTSYRPSFLTHISKRKGGVRFSANLTEKITPGSTIKVAFHRDEPRAKSSPKHIGNIAR